MYVNTAVQYTYCALSVCRLSAPSIKTGFLGAKSKTELPDRASLCSAVYRPRLQADGLSFGVCSSCCRASARIAKQVLPPYGRRLHAYAKQVPPLSLAGPHCSLHGSQPSQQTKQVFAVLVPRSKASAALGYQWQKNINPRLMTASLCWNCIPNLAVCQWCFTLAHAHRTALAIP